MRVRLEVIKMVVDPKQNYPCDLKGNNQVMRKQLYNTMKLFKHKKVTFSDSPNSLLYLPCL